MLSAATMKTLAIDSSLSAGSVAALWNGRLAQRIFPVAGEHGRRLATALRDVAGELGWSPAAVDLVAVVRGPGSFTSLRVGVTTAKAIAWASGAKLLGISAFEVIARQTAVHIQPSALSNGTAPPIAIAYDAGRGEVFAATAVFFSDTLLGWQVGPAQLFLAADWLASLAPGTCISGPALTLLTEQLVNRPDLVLSPSTAWTPLASEVGALAIQRAAAGESDDPSLVLPEYLRPSYADEKASLSSR